MQNSVTANNPLPKKEEILHHSKEAYETAMRLIEETIQGGSSLRETKQYRTHYTEQHKDLVEWHFTNGSIVEISIQLMLDDNYHAFVNQYELNSWNKHELIFSEWFPNK